MKNLLISAVLLAFGLNAHAAELTLAELAGLPESTVFSTGAPLVAAETGDVVLTYLGSQAADSNKLWFDSNDSSPLSVLLTKGASAAMIGQTFNLGSFEAGSELQFSLQDLSTGHVFENTGTAYLKNGIVKDDIQAHTKVWFDQGHAYVGFEDRSLKQHSDWDYNDLVFKVSNVAVVPEPESYALISMGLLAIGFARRRKSR